MANIDHTSAQSAFISVTFGVNTLFAFYKSFREAIEGFAKQRVSEFSAAAKAIEPQHDGPRLQKLVKELEDLNEKHTKIQASILPWAIVFSVFCATICLVVLFFDLLRQLGHYNALLILPFPLYCIISCAICLGFWWHMRCKIRRFENYVSEFEPPPPPPAPPL